MIPTEFLKKLPLFAIATLILNQSIWQINIFIKFIINFVTIYTVYASPENQAWFILENPEYLISVDFQCASAGNYVS